MHCQHQCSCCAQAGRPGPCPWPRRPADRNARWLMLQGRSAPQSRAMQRWVRHSVQDAWPAQRHNCSQSLHSTRHRQPPNPGPLGSFVPWPMAGPVWCMMLCCHGTRPQPRPPQQQRMYCPGRNQPPDALGTSEAWTMGRTVPVCAGCLHCRGRSVPGRARPLARARDVCMAAAQRHGSKCLWRLPCWGWAGRCCRISKSLAMEALPLVQGVGRTLTVVTVTACLLLLQHRVGCVRSQTCCVRTCAVAQGSAGSCGRSSGSSDHTGTTCSAYSEDQGVSHARRGVGQSGHTESCRPGALS